MVYQEQISGIERLADGRIAEYTHHDLDTGKPVSFDGHTHRGHPPVEVFLEAKDGYAQLHYRPDSDWSTRVSARLAAQADRQLTVVPEGARLEWHVSDPHGAAGIRTALAERGIFEVDVVYTPRIGQR